MKMFKRFLQALVGSCKCVRSFIGGDDAAPEESPEDELGDDPESEPANPNMVESQEPSPKDNANDGPHAESSSDEESVESHGSLSAETLVMGEERPRGRDVQPSSQASEDAQDGEPDSQVSSGWMGKAINAFNRQEEAQKKAENVDRLVKAGHTVVT